MIDKYGTVDIDVELGVQATGSSWRKLTGVLYDRKIPLRLKAKVYEAIIRPALTYGSECWAMKVTNKSKIATTEMSIHASRDPRSAETRSHGKSGNPTHTKRITDRRGYAQWSSSLVRTCPETRCKHRHPQSDGAGNTRYQTTRTSQEDMAPTDQGRHDGRECYPGCGPRPGGVEKKDL